MGFIDSDTPQERIAAILAPKPDDSINSIVKALPALKAGPLPCITSTDLLLPHLNPRQCCFDTASDGLPPSWTCNKLCQRCDLLSRLLRETSHAQDDLVDNLIGQVHLTTSCKDDARKGETSALPRELADIVFDYALDHLLISEDPASFCSLFHVSSWVRLKMLQAFKPVEMWECDVLLSQYDQTTEVHRSLSVYASAMPEYRMTDATLRRYGVVSAPTRLGATKLFPHRDAKMVQWIVKVEAHNLYDGKGKTLIVGGSYAHSHSTREVNLVRREPLLTVTETYDALDLAFEGLDASAWRFASPFQRLLSGTLSPFTARAKVTVTLQLPHENNQFGTPSKQWISETLTEKVTV